MSSGAAPGGPLHDALLAAALLRLDPKGLGGLCLRGGGPARDLVLGALGGTDRPIRRLPAHIDDQRLLGGIEVAASLASGRTVHERGLLADAAGGSVIVPMAERLDPAIAGRLAQAMDTAAPGDGFALVLLDDGMTPEEAPPPALTERCAFICDLSAVGSLDHPAAPQPAANNPEAVSLDDDALASLAVTAAALGIGSARAMIFAAHAAQAHAALHGRTAAIAADLEAAARLVLAPRATQLPAFDDPDEDPPDESPPDTSDNEDQGNPGDRPFEDVVLDAAMAAIPPNLLALLTGGRTRRGSGGGGGKRMKSLLRGKPLSARPGMPRGGARLALVDSLRAAVPWQALRRREAPSPVDTALILRKDDLRVRRFEERAGKVSIFCVDASGSAAAARLAEAKGAVELMLAQAYTTRSEVALVAFRGQDAEVLLPPTRSLTRARRALAELPGGGGTPLAAGLRTARELAEAIALRGRTPQLVILTDGRANIAADGSASRSRAAQDAEAQAKAIAGSGIEALVVDISARSTPDAPRLAAAMQARFLALPMADARKLHAAVLAAQPGSRAA